MNSIAQIRNASTADLVAFYNEHANGNPIKKFETRQKAIDRCVKLAVLMGMADELEGDKEHSAEVRAEDVEAVKVAKAEIEEAEQKGRAAFAALFGMSSAQTEAHAQLGKTEAKTKIIDGKVATEEEIEPVNVGRAANSAGVAESWKNPEVMEARLHRNGVMVKFNGNTKQYTSVNEAFRDLRLPVAKHIRFRVKLKGVGELVFAHEGVDYEFSLTEVPSKK